MLFLFPGEERKGQQMLIIIDTHKCKYKFTYITRDYNHEKSPSCDEEDSHHPIDPNSNDQRINMEIMIMQRIRDIMRREMTKKI